MRQKGVRKNEKQREEKKRREREEETRGVRKK